jgi:hypothetical protein
MCYAPYAPDNLQYMLLSMLPILYDPYRYGKWMVHVLVIVEETYDPLFFLKDVGITR